MNRRLAVLVACFCTIFASYAVRYGYGILLPEMLPSLDITKTEAGVIYSSFFIAYTVSSPVLGLLGDRYNTRLLLTLFVAVFGAGTLLMTFSSSIIQASLFFVLVGIGSAVCWAPTTALAQRWTSEKTRGRTLAFIDVGSALGIIGTSTVVPAIVTAHDWRAGWLGLGVFVFLVAILNFFAVRNPPANPLKPPVEKPGQPGAPIPGTTYKELLRNRKFWLIGLAYMLTGFSIIIPFTFLSTYAVQELSFSYSVSTRLITIIGVGAIIGKVLLGPLSDKIGRIKIMMLCAVLIAVGSLGMAYGRGAGLIIFTVIFSFGYGTAWSMYAAAASDYFSRQSAGSIVGLWTVYLGIGSVISPVIAGWIADTTGTLTWSFILASAGGFVSLLLLVPVWRSSKV
jgi:OFA family oxalate/formate antiporter-like MFS transporter